MELALHLVNSMTMMASFALLFGIVSRRAWPELVRHCLLGGLFGLGAFLSMLQPVMVFGTAIIDCRALFTGFAGAFLGLPGAIVAVAVAAVGRLCLGISPMAFLGIGGMVLAASMGMLWSATCKRMPAGRLRFTVLGMMISVSFILYFFVPGFGDTVDHAEKIAMLTMFNILGALLLGSVIHRDQAQAHEAMQARHAASTDVLTGLLNRRGFRDRLREVETRKSLKGSALLIVDLDHFKTINDAHGHAAGDRVLRLTGERLRGAVGPSDVVMRMGGEEFGILLTDIAETETLTAAERIRKAVCAPCPIAGTCAIHVTASVGVGRWKIGSESLEDVCETADRALYLAKSRGRDTVVMG